MTRNEANQHLIKARRVIAVWEHLGMPSGPLEDVSRMIHEEIGILGRIIAEHPAKATAVGDLVKRYEAMGRLVRDKAH